MSRLNDLLRQLRMENPGLADDLRREYDALADRRSFGLNFERHVPEAVELPGRKVRKGDKVRILPPRGETRTRRNDRLWRVLSTATVGGARSADLVSLDDAADEATVAVDDLIVVAEFRDPIYPGLVSTGKVERGGDRPYHAVINAENFHALQTLLFTHRGKVDCIYIDPPYNTGARDWKYNNDYVEGEDLYRHSKWLAFMERRLLLAKELLNPDDSVLIVTIDEKEYLRLGLLLEQLFPDATIQMVSSVINPAGSARRGAMFRTDEYIFTVLLGTCTPVPLSLSDEWRTAPGKASTGLAWENLLRRGTAAGRVDRPGMFYAIHLDDTCSRVLEIGNALPLDADRLEYERAHSGTIVWPLRSDGREGRWKVGPETLRELLGRGYVRVGRPRGSSTAVSYLPAGEQAKVADGLFVVVGNRADGSIEVEEGEQSRRFVPGTQWRIPSHNAAEYGSNLNYLLIETREFSFPKSLYAVEDVLRLYLADKPHAVVVDFFAGSGTTGHAVCRVNRIDGGHRQAILVTNNEVAADEQQTMRQTGLRPGDNDWESHGICRRITIPRIRAAISGLTPSGTPISGNYKFTDVFAMSEGFEENAEFFDLTYEAPLRVASNREFGKIAPLLWLRAGSRGRRIDDITAGWDVADVYGVIVDLDQGELFLKAIAENDDAAMAFIVTDEDRLFESLVAELPDHVEPVRLYEAYLRNFEIEAGRATR